MKCPTLGASRRDQPRLTLVPVAEVTAEVVVAETAVMVAMEVAVEEATDTRQIMERHIPHGLLRRMLTVTRGTTEEAEDRVQGGETPNGALEVLAALPALSAEALRPASGETSPGEDGNERGQAGEETVANLREGGPGRVTSHRRCYVQVLLLRPVA